MVSIQGSRLLSDLPETDPEFLWDGLKKLSEQLAKQIPDLPTTSPVMISGDWGSGKTTLLKAIQNKLDKGATPTVWFEAWRYEGESLRVAQSPLELGGGSRHWHRADLGGGSRRTRCSGFPGSTSAARRREGACAGST